MASAYRTSHAEPVFQSLSDPSRPDNRAFPTALDPFLLSRYEIAEFAREAQALDVHYLGVCCGAGPHHIRSLAEALGRRPPVELVRRVNGLDVGLPLDPRAPDREAERQDWDEVDERHRDVPHPRPLAEVDPFVAKEDVARFVAHRVPGVGDPELAEHHGVVPREVHALPAEREHGEEVVDRALEARRALRQNLERRELSGDLGEEGAREVAARGDD